MALTWGETNTEVKKRLGLGEGTKYNDRAYFCMNAAGRLIYTVKWDCLRTSGSGSVGSGAEIVSSIPDDFGFIDKESVYITSGSTVTKMVEGSWQDIVENPPATAGMPLHFITAGKTSGNVQRLYVGCPTADASYSLSFSYWPIYADWSSSNSTQTHPINTLFGDQFLISLAAVMFAKYFELEESGPVVSSNALKDAIMYVSMIEETRGYLGPSLLDMLKAEGIQ